MEHKMASLGTLTEDVEIDGEVIANERPDCRFKFSRTSLDKNVKVDTREDSGFVSMSPGTSLESTESLKQDKLSVQCSDGNGDNRASDRDSTDELEKKIKCIDLGEDEDEGIELSKSIDSLNSNVSDIVEVDLFERDYDGDTLIHIAIVGGMTIVAAALIDMAEDKECLNLQNDLFQTPLHLAIITENYDIAIQLIRKGADVKRCDKQGNTPLHLACRKGEKAVIRALLETFGDDELAKKKYFAAKNCEGLTCLHLAAEQKHFLVMGYLFAKKADVNMGDAKSGRTILHYAVEKKDLESVVLLLTHPDINVDCKTFKGETPLVLAYWRNYQDIVKKLKTKGAYFSYDLFDDLDNDSS